jgi:hypothetical protein
MGGKEDWRGMGKTSGNLNASLRLHEASRQTHIAVSAKAACAPTSHPPHSKTLTRL